MRRKVKVGKAFDLSVVMKKSVAVGHDFDAEIKVSGNIGDTVDAITRERIVWAVFGMMALFLIGAGVYGLYHDEFSKLSDVWGVTAPLYGGIAGYFFWRPDNGRGRPKA